MQCPKKKYSINIQNEANSKKKDCKVDAQVEVEIEGK
jgi:hypothetical protein